MYRLPETGHSGLVKIQQWILKEIRCFIIVRKKEVEGLGGRGGEVFLRSERRRHLTKIRTYKKFPNLERLG